MRPSKPLRRVANKLLRINKGFALRVARRMPRGQFHIGMVNRFFHEQMARHNAELSQA